MNRRTRIKICGLTRPADVDAAVRAGTDAIGLVFYPSSPRCVTLQLAQTLAQRLPPFVTPVGLFVNAAPRDVEQALRLIPHLVLQFHGDESVHDCEQFGRPYLRAARITPGFDLLDFAHRYQGAQALLLDAHVQGYGGGGKVFDWTLIPPGLPCPLVLSGGLHDKNVGDGIAALRPWAVDVSSGVEQAKGIKDAQAMHQFCQAVWRADAP
jgi:phosphoribosylanthranilate isomerase